MGMNFQITDAAHLYGLDNMGASATLAAANAAILGSVLAEVDSWGTGALPVGSAGVVTDTLSGGFTEKIGFSNLDGTNYVLDSVQFFRTATNELLMDASGSVNFTIANMGTALQIQNIFSGNDIIYGNSYDNVLRGGYAANDQIDGGGGQNTVIFSGLSSQYQIAQSGSAMSVTGPAGTDTLVNIQTLQFDDQSIAYNVNGNAGTAAKIIGAVFGAGMVSNAQYEGIGIRALAAGMSEEKLMQTAISVALGANATNSTDVVNLLYTNVVGTAPDPASLIYYKGMLDSGSISVASLGVLAAETSINAAHINLVGLATTGIHYT